MEFKCITLSPKTMKSLLPERVIMFLSDKGTVVYGAVEDDIISGILVFIASKDSGRYRKLWYYNVLDRPDRADVFVGLFSYAIEDLRKHGIKVIITKFFGNAGEEIFFYDVFDHFGFLPTLIDGKVLTYRAGDLLDTAFAAKKESLAKLKADCIPLKEMPEIALRRFIRASEEDGRKYDFDLFDENFSMFYFDDDKIQGFMAFVKGKKESYALWDEYFTEEAENGYVIPVMLSCLLDNLEKYSTIDGKVVLHTPRANIYRGFKSLFGEPVSELLMYEMIKIL